MFAFFVICYWHCKVPNVIAYCSKVPNAMKVCPKAANSVFCWSYKWTIIQIDFLYICTNVLSCLVILRRLLQFCVLVFTSSSNTLWLLIHILFTSILAYKQVFLAPLLVQSGTSVETRLWKGLAQNNWTLKIVHSNNCMFSILTVWYGDSATIPVLTWGGESISVLVH